MFINVNINIITYSNATDDILYLLEKNNSEVVCALILIFFKFDKARNIRRMFCRVL